MMRRIIALTLCVLFLVGCQRETGVSAPVKTEESSSPQSSTEAAESETSVISPRFEDCDIPPIETLDVYRYWGDGKIYTRQEVKFVGEQDILTAVNLAASVVPAVREKTLFIRGITREKAFVTVDFDQRFVEEYSKREFYEILTTIAMSLQKNAIADSVCFTLDGEVGVFGEVFTPAPFAVAEGDSAEFARIRAAIPYPGMSEAYFPTVEEIFSRFGVSMDETAYEIAVLLSRVGRIEQDAASPQALEPSRIYYHVIRQTPYFSTDSQYDLERYEKSLLPIADSVSVKLGMEETMFWIGEHLSQTARLLLGDDFVLDLSQGEGNKYRYFPEEGVVTPPHMGGGYQTIPLVLSYEETKDGYRAEVVYLFEGMGSISEWGTESALTEQELPEYVKSQAARAEVELRREGDGRLCFASYRVKT